MSGAQLRTRPDASWPADAVVVGVDGGGSKTDVVALSLDGEIVGRERGEGSSPHFEGLEASVRTVDALVRAVAGGRPVVQTDLYLSGLDLPIEIDDYRAAIRGLSWANESTVLANDLYALLRAGTDEPDAVVVVCGTGMNAVGVRADGSDVRFPSLGGISGDWGGGSGLGEQALWHAARDIDGRGVQTALTAAIVERLGAASLIEIIEDLHFGRRAGSELAVLAPLVFECARDGDAVAAALVDRQADEIAAFARACLTRLDLLDRPVPVVLGGGIVSARDARLLDGIAAGLSPSAPHARIEIFEGPPIVGAALLALQHAGAGAPELARARSGWPGSRSETSALVAIP
ncbi:N-acetylglucosamine kinase [Agromyces protaetiae]|uniref:N-acetylglucosamine kinase n=1 Tax=Agromyces protaetiae TaxID=2509455 RepID=A0A4P6FVT5_9MICO|nr:BadF/BadG/BcrA/BcrD ATPase family protein [Agromyces protaetiae]QAY74728.1 N-acetylglucosamine kinase [Agromyces protaetiae]